VPPGAAAPALRLTLTPGPPTPPPHPNPPPPTPDIIGLIGAIVFWPSTVYFPIAMYNRVRSPPPWQRAVFSAVNAICFVVSLLAAVGSCWQIAQDAGNYKMFGGRRR
jgi:hypothetical protein